MISKHFLESIRYETAPRTALQFAPQFFEPFSIVQFGYPSTEPADVLGMLRPFFFKQLESQSDGPSAEMTTRADVYIRDVLEFAKERDKEGLAALDLLARDAFEADPVRAECIP